MKSWAKFFIIVEAILRFVGGIVLMLLSTVIDKIYEDNPVNIVTSSVDPVTGEVSYSSYVGVADHMSSAGYLTWGIIFFILGIGAFVLCYFAFQYMDENDPRFIYVAIIGFVLAGPIGYLMYFFGMKKEFVLVDKLEAEMSPPIDEEKTEEPAEKAL